MENADLEGRRGLAFAGKSKVRRCEVGVERKHAQRRMHLRLCRVQHGTVALSVNRCSSTQPFV